MTVPNWLSIVRLALVPLIVWAMVSGADVWAFGLFTLAALSDALDGFLARRLSLESDLGRILDPLADKVLIGTTMIAATYTGLLPLWLTALVVARDIAIVAVIAAARRSGHARAVRPSMLGKASTLLQSILVGLVLFAAATGLTLEPVRSALVVAVAGLSILAGLGYLANWRNGLAGGGAAAR